jgi:iron complex outermembrane recepter protein
MKKPIASVVAAFSAVLIVASSHAQSQDDDAIVVTANRFAELKRNLPIGMTIITAEDIRSSATSNLPEILAQFGQLHIRDLAGSPNQQIDLRGFGITGDQNTLILVNGVRISENEQTAAQLSSIPLDSIERIEILRGGGAVLYGGGATGGTINIITRRARAGETSAYALGRLGGYGTQELRAGYSRQGEVLGASLALSDEDTRGYRSNNQFHQTNVAGSLEARLSDARAYLRFMADDQRLRLPGSLTEAQIAVDPRQTLTPGDYSELNGGQVVFGGAVNSGKHEFSTDLAYRTKHSNAFFAAFGGFFIDTKVTTWSFTPRARLGFDLFGREQNVVLGLDADHWDYTTENSNSPATISSPFSHRVGNQSNNALYGQANLQLAETTRLVVGSRAQRNTDRLAEQVFPLDDRRATRTLHADELGLRQGIGAGLSGYVRYGTSFRVANPDDNACFFPPCAPSLLVPQTAKGGEFGLEFERSGMRVRASVYQMRLNNEIYFSPLAGANINLSPTERQGAELEASWRDAKDLDLRAGLALMQARFRSGVYGGVNVSGKDVPLIPEAIATAGASWNFAARSRLVVNLRYVGKQRYDNDQANLFGRRQPDYALADVKLDYRMDRFTLAFEVRNLFDKQYYSYATWNGATSFSALPAPGRAAYVSLAYRLD